MELIWTNRANDDLVEIRAYIAEDSVRYADAMVSKILQAEKKIKPTPQAWHMVREFLRDDIREFQVKPYRLIYQIGEDQIRILRVIHQARLLPDLEL